ncbi:MULTISPECIES: methyltransferase domain-containing protein [Alcanivorax]|jgi:ubiquinone/menaquinone biosynthesis C-methylase UbiE|uniref:methyltransferase domain-containing protein n=1 Tax=Alcanivorax TaxID=59753 RepID=UPI000C5A9074|nr:methyltransferase domain-containing protein [Alcanivorax jadensis]MBG32822.1 methyltransferase type 11 [Alcanivorax sp.]MDF1636263.1 methyltransferase domain-containing protein [Alcanivorax jadensis]|tara:strand:- start:1219 stop:2262 length:1044 start_codon:yes stop_codon:yes gene_type:complete
MREEVQNYYGQQLHSSDDLQTNACCDQEPPAYLKPLLAQLHDEVVMRYYGCGLVAPQQLKGMRILDLGSGSGRDVYLLSALVGEQGEVVGVDMTDEQLEVARRYQDYHRDVFGYAKSNVRFLKGYIEELDQLDLQEGYFDIVISNCVINLSTDKPKVIRDVKRLLKPGGEFFFSDVYADRRVPQPLLNDPVLYGECLAGALYWNDFINLAKQNGFADPRLVESRRLTIENPDIEARLGQQRFYSATYRLFNIEGLEPACEDYGQAVIYQGTVDQHPHAFMLDDHHVIETGKVFPVCGNTWLMLEKSRFAEHFTFIGNFDTHYGIFEGCGLNVPFEENDASNGAAPCC